MADNEWKHVVGYEGLYEVSSAGRIRSLGWQTTAGYRKGRVLKSSPDSGGYPAVTLVKNKTRRTVRLHTAVCLAFHGPAPSPLHEVAHGDGLRTNAAAGNLRWATKTSNQLDKKAHGTDFVGDRHPRVKVPDANVQLIASEYVKGSATHGLRALAKKYGVSIMPIHRIVRGVRQVAT